MQNFACYTQNFNNATLLKCKDTTRTTPFTTFCHTFRSERKTHYKKTACKFLRAFCFAKLFLLQAKLQHRYTAQRAKHTSRTHSRRFAVFTAKLTVKKHRQVFRLFSTFSFPFIYLSRSFRCHSPTFSPDSKKVATIGISHFQCDILPDFP